MTYTISSTGFEKKFTRKNEHEEPYLTIKKQLCNFIWKAYISGVSSFCVNCEYGIPLWAAEIICALKQYNNIRLHIVIPFEEQTTDWGENLRDRYFAIHEKADTVVMASNQYTPNCYNLADEIMAANSDMIFIFAEKLCPLHICSYAPVNRIRWFIIK